MNEPFATQRLLRVKRHFDSFGDGTLDELKEHIAQIEAEAKKYGPDAVIRVESEEYRLEFECTGPETDAEMAERVEQERKRFAQQRERRHQEYLALKKEFE